MLFLHLESGWSNKTFGKTYYTWKELWVCREHGGKQSPVITVLTASCRASIDPANQGSAYDKKQFQCKAKCQSLLKSDMS